MPTVQYIAADVFKLLYHTTNINDYDISLVLEHIGRWLEVSRVYIFENDKDGLGFSNTFEWCNDNIKPEINNLQNLKFSELGIYYDNFDQNGIFVCTDVKNMQETQRKIIEKQNIKSMLQYGMKKDGQYYGIIGFDECRTNHEWTRVQVDALVRTAEVITMFLSYIRSGQSLSDK